MTREERLAQKRAYNKVYYTNNRDELVVKKREYREANREKVNKSQQRYVAQNQDKIRLAKKNYYLKNRDKIREKRASVSEKSVGQRRLYRLNNKERIKEYERNRYLNNPSYRIATVVRARIRDIVKREHRSLHTEELLGATFQQFKDYLEKLFKPDMTWNNHGKWEIDHIIPLSSFDLTKIEEQKRAFHYTNTQPLWVRENRQKCAKILN